MGSDGKSDPAIGEAVPTASTNGAADTELGLDASDVGATSPSPPAAMPDGGPRPWLIARAVPRVITVARPRAERLASFLRYPPSGRLLLRLGIPAVIVVPAVLRNRTLLGWGLFATCAVLFVPLRRTLS